MFGKFLKSVRVVRQIIFMKLLHFFSETNNYTQNKMSFDNIII